MADNLTTRVRRLLESPVSEAGADLEDVEVRAVGRRRLVRVCVDTDTGISLDDVAAITKVVSTVLDETDVMGDFPYVLEVTSPGVERPLASPRHWRRNQNRLVRVKLSGNGEPMTGRITDNDNVGVTLDVDGTALVLPFDEIERAVVQVELNSPAGQNGPSAESGPSGEHHGH